MALPRNVCVIGATGLVGRQIVRALLEEDEVARVRTLVRRPSGEVHPKLEELIVDFEERKGFARSLDGEALFSAMGTTIKAAGSQAAQRRVDHDYQLWAAEAARERGCELYVLVSSMGADPRSTVFYSRIKGELERAVEELNFPSACILRPGLLEGERSEKRTGERMLLGLARRLPPWPALAPVRPIHAQAVAAAAIQVARDRRAGTHKFEAKELFELSTRGRVV